MDDDQDGTAPESVSTSESDDKKPGYLDEVRRQLFENLTRPDVATGIIGSIVVLYLAFAWLIISPVIEAFWPW